jgi:D-3-phosphoglycerate dehydrogenase
MINKWKVLLFQSMHERGMDYLRERAEVVVAPSYEEEVVLPLAREADAIIIRAVGKITERVLDNAPRLRVIGRHGVGLDGIDLEGATRRGIWVVYTPGANSVAVAEHAVGMMISVAKGMTLVDREVRRGGWDVRNRRLGKQLHGATLGVIGLGRIGRLVAGTCRRGFDMRVLYYDIVRYRELEESIPCQLVPLERLLRESEVVTIHVPLTPLTAGMIGEAELALMKPEAILINTARGAVVDEEALAEALQQGRIYGAGVDVFKKEPPEAGHRLFEAENAVFTAHMAAHTEEAMAAMSTMVAEDVIRVLAGEVPKHAANEPRRREE